MYIPFSFYFALFHFVSEFTLSTLVHFYILHFYSPVLLLLLQTQTTPKKGRDIIPDILDPVLQPDPTFSILYTLLILPINNVKPF
jgi:hypothetical protein